MILGQKMRQFIFYVLFFLQVDVFLDTKIM
jgi:hypothetical protein